MELLEDFLAEFLDCDGISTEIPDEAREEILDGTSAGITIALLLYRIPRRTFREISLWNSYSTSRFLLCV